MAAKVTLDEMRTGLRIDADDLDTCLTDQADLYYHVAEAHVMAVARRDQIKLELDEATAELDKELREQAAETKEKLTEDAIKQRLRTVPELKQLTRDYLAARVEAAHWEALKEAYDQKSYALNKLVDRQVAQLYGLGVGRGMSNRRGELAERNLTVARRANRK